MGNLAECTGFETFHLDFDDSGLCECVEFCETHQNALKISTGESKGDKGLADSYIKLICEDPARRVEETCYQDLLAQGVDTVMPLFIDGQEDPVKRLPWDPNLPRPPQDTRIVLRGRSPHPLEAENPKTGERFIMSYDKQSNTYSWDQMNSGGKE